MNESPTHPRRVDLRPVELRAIEEHKYFLSRERGGEVSIEEAIDDFLHRFAEEWRRDRTRRDLHEQRSEIEKHRYLRSIEEQRDIGSAAAAEEWCERYAAIWRADRESLERNDFKRIMLVIRDPDYLHLRPWSAIARRVAGHDCDVYVHRAGMPYWNFLLEGRPFMNVRSVLGMLSLGIALGDPLEFIALGAEADQALASLRRALERGAPPPAED